MALRQKNELIVADEYEDLGYRLIAPRFKSQLLKWIGNKQKQAADIISYFPSRFGVYFEPFLGSGGVLASLAPSNAVASDIFPPLMEIWETLHHDKNMLKQWYSDRYSLINDLGKKSAYDRVLASYNHNPNGADLLFVLRACYGGVVRFRKSDGFMSTPCGVHDPITPGSFSKRVDLWHGRVKNVIFNLCDFETSMNQAQPGDLVYCDPPYSDSQSILYGAQSFSLERLFEVIHICKKRGVYVAMSIDGIKYSGRKQCKIEIPPGLFKREIFINIGRSMLKRFQMDGKSLENHVVSDRLLLTY